MPTVLLVRHGRSTANTSGVLAGWTPGIRLDDVGRGQAAELAGRLAALPLARAVMSPLERCVQTAQLLLGVPGPGGGQRPAPLTDDRLGECRYGEWTGRPLKDLVTEPLWGQVQAHPSAVTFPGADGESMSAMQHRAVTAVREHDAAVEREHGPDAVWLAVSHGDLIKAVIADALGMHLDGFQRIVVDPCSVSVIRYTRLRPFVVRINDAGTDLGALRPAPRAHADAAEGSAQDGAQAAGESDAVPGGGAGPVPAGPHRGDPAAAVGTP